MFAISILHVYYKYELAAMGSKCTSRLGIHAFSGTSSFFVTMYPLCSWG